MAVPSATALRQQLEHARDRPGRQVREAIAEVFACSPSARTVAGCDCPVFIEWHENMHAEQPGAGDEGDEDMNALRAFARAGQPTPNAEAAFVTERATRHEQMPSVIGSALGSGHDPRAFCADLTPITLAAQQAAARYEPAPATEDGRQFGQGSRAGATLEHLAHTIKEAAEQPRHSSASYDQIPLPEAHHRRTWQSHQEWMDGDVFLQVEDPELLRAVPASSLLRSSWLWRDSTGCEETFAQSRPAAEIGTFLSHSWRTPGWLKIIGMMYHFNAPRALVAAICFHIAFHACELSGTFAFPIPATHDNSTMFSGDEIVASARYQLQFVPALVVFFLVFWLGQEACWGKRFCFLDKCCTHQTAPAQKAAGIRQLGAFLRCSKSMLVLWQPEYFTRLWCVYELAAYIHISGGDCRRVHFCLLKMAVLAVAWCTLLSAGSVGFALLAPLIVFHPWHTTWVSEQVPELAQYMYLVLIMMGLCTVVVAPLAPFLWVFCKWHIRDRRELMLQLQSFSFANAQCHEDSDRLYVQKRIEDWFGGVAPFEAFVQTDLAQHVEDCLQQQRLIPYLVAVIGTLPQLVHGLTYIAQTYNDGIAGLLKITICALCNPLTVAVAVGCVMRLADTSFGDGAVGASSSSSLLCRRLGGAVATTMIISCCVGANLALQAPAAPTWLAGVIFVLFVAVAASLYLPRRVSQ